MKRELKKIFERAREIHLGLDEWREKDGWKTDAERILGIDIITLD